MYKACVLSLRCADKVEVFVVPMEGEQLQGSPSACSSRHQEGTGRWTNGLEAKLGLTLQRRELSKGAKCVDSRSHPEKAEGSTLMLLCPSSGSGQEKRWLLGGIWQSVCKGLFFLTSIYIAVWNWWQVVLILGQVFFFILVPVAE